MRRRLLVFAAAFAALPAGVALAAIASGNFTGHGTSQTGALFSITVNGSNQISKFTSNHVHFTCSDTGARGHTGRGTVAPPPVIPIAMNNSFSFKFASAATNPALKGKVSGHFTKPDVAKGTYQENLVLDNAGHPDPNGANHCQTGKVAFKVTRQ